MASADTSTLGVSILIPAFNEEGAIEETVKKISEQRRFFRELEIVVINDGSEDGTGEIARRLPVTLLEHESNRGYGAALKTGCRPKSGLVSTTRPSRPKGRPRLTSKR